MKACENALREVASTHYGEACDAHKKDVLAAAASAHRAISQHNTNPTATARLVPDLSPDTMTHHYDSSIETLSTHPTATARLVPDLSVLGKKCFDYNSEQEWREELLISKGGFSDSNLDIADGGGGGGGGDDNSVGMHTDCNIPESIATLLPPCAWDEYYSDPYVEATTQCFWHALGKRHFLDISQPGRGFGRVCK